MRHVIIFAICFALGATVALIGRSAVHDAYHQAPAVGAPAPPPPAPAPALDHQHAASPQAAPGPDQSSPDVAGGTPAVANTICPSCGMPVDPDIAPVVSGGTAIGVACPPCIPKITRDFARHAEAAARNARVR